MWQVFVFCLAMMSAVQPQPFVRTSDLDYSDIKPVTNDTRFTVQNPSVELRAFTKVKHSKGNVVFAAGERISGDRLIVNHYDDESFTTIVDIEVLMSYPASGNAGVTITCIEIYVDMTADDAGAFMIEGGIGRSNAKILLTCNNTRSFVYETFFYGS